MPQTALIFGISGQDGAYLAELLLAKGYCVHGTSRDAEISTFASLTALDLRDRVTLHSAVPTDFRSVLQAIDRATPDEVYNLSGQSSVGLSFLEPVETLQSISVGTLNILEAIRFLDRPIRLYNAASSECFGNTDEAGADENTAFRPVSPYGVAKAAAYWQVVNYRESYGLFASNGLLFNHESPLRPQRFVTAKIVAAATRIAAGSDEALTLGDISVRRDWGWAPEYVDAMWRMLQQPTPGDYVVATGTCHSLKDFTASAFAFFDLDWHDHVRLDPALHRPTDLAVSRGNADKAARQLDWRADTVIPDLVLRLSAAAAESP